ncbi:phage/plasmid primase, P4 family [Bacteroides sp.]|uniref:DNA primase family protein n=1 Tax=Bacteroides sp. TaxID=29523 RepID=UPI0026110D45|nr:DNA primase family protein [Bacteroides sp.]MDD3041175.1 phage/plasmid primase, P4 family [Bacteroides sp.]
MESATKQYTVKEVEKIISAVKVSESEAENVEIASNVIFLYMSGISKSDGMKLIKFKIRSHFNIKDTDSIKILNQKLNEVIKNHEKNIKRNEKNEEADGEIKLPFNEVADRVIQKQPLFTMKDTGEFFLYKDGMYKNDVASRTINKIIRDEYQEYFLEQWNALYPDKEPDNVPAAKAGFVSEVMEYIIVNTFEERRNIDADQGRYINFKNGLFDMRKWKLIPHTPDVITISQVNASYEPAATCHNINAYFTSCRLPEESKTILVEFAGYCLTYDVKLQKALMLFGNGSNGKSVFINLLKTILGYEMVSGESLHQLETDKYRVANLYGKTLNAFPDLKNAPLQTNEVFNTLTGNDKYLTGERKYQNSFSFENTAKLMFSANKIPFARSDNFAYYRRWLLVEFPYTFKDGEIDEGLIDKITTEQEKSGFVNLMLEGLKTVFENRKFSYSLSVEEVENTYLLHSDNVTAFEEQCMRDCEADEFPTEKNQTYNWYKTWCQMKNLTPVKEKAFTARLGKLGRKIFSTTRVINTGGKPIHVKYYENTVVDFKSNNR